MLSPYSGLTTRQTYVQTAPVAAPVAVQYAQTPVVSTVTPQYAVPAVTTTTLSPSYSAPVLPTTTSVIPGVVPTAPNAISSLQYNGMQNFNLIACGNGISPNESAAIKRAAFEGLQNGANPLSNFVAKRIKELLNGDWLAVCYDRSNPKDFSLTTVRSSDFMVFIIGNVKFEICRLREGSDITQNFVGPSVIY